MTDEAIGQSPGATIVKFRARLREQGLMATLFDDVVSHLTERGLIVQEGTRVDATIIEAPRGPRRPTPKNHRPDRRIAAQPTARSRPPQPASPNAH